MSPKKFRMTMCLNQLFIEYKNGMKVAVFLNYISFFINFEMRSKKDIKRKTFFKSEKNYITAIKTK